MRYCIKGLDVASAVLAGILCAAIVLIPDTYDWHFAITFLCIVIPFCAAANRTRCRGEAQAKAQGLDHSVDDLLTEIVGIAKDARQSRLSNPGHQAAD